MKNLFQRLTFTFLFGLFISLAFTSCGDDTKEAYVKEIIKADALFENKEYDEAKASYVKALGIKKDEVYPQGQIDKIDALSANKLDQNYKDKIKKADSLFANKEYAKAKAAYLDAITVKPSDSYPQTKINEINTLLKAKTVKKSAPYHIVMGSYAIEENALSFQKVLESNGRKSIIFKSREGNYLVSVKSLTTLTKAYNYLGDNKDNLGYSPWVYMYKIK